MKVLLINFIFLALLSPLNTFASKPLSLKIPQDYLNNLNKEKLFNPTKNSEQKQKLIIVIGNDGISGNLSDRHLTSQLKFGKITQQVPKAFQSYIEDQNYIIMTLSHDIYTPEDIRETELIEGDTPYAGWLYLTLGKLEQSENHISVTTVDIGIVGPSAKGEAGQKEIHALVGSPQPNGWEHQLRDELGIKFEHEKYFRTPFAINSYISGEFLKFYGGTLGNIRTSLKTGGAIRIGRNIPNDLSIGINKTQNQRMSVFGFLKVQGEYVLQNIFLDGNTFKDSHSVDKNDFVAEISAGITIMKGTFGFSLNQFITTKEFTTQEEVDTNAELRFVFDFMF